MEDQDIIAYKSSFIPNMNINLVFKENPNYGVMRKIFDQYGYGFLAPELKTIFIDGEIFLGDDGLTMEDMKFIEAHEIAHLLLGHNGPRSEKDEIEADLGAYILLKKNEMSTDRLEDEFDSRHGMPFSEDLLDMVKDRL
jgi:Zn-dependent peptidase ImmA (M78 family)